MEVKYYGHLHRKLPVPIEFSHINRLIGSFTICGRFGTFPTAQKWHEPPHIKAEIRHRFHENQERRGLIDDWQWIGQWANDQQIESRKNGEEPSNAAFHDSKTSTRRPSRNLRKDP